MLIEIKDFWFIETSTVTGIRLDIKGWWKKYPVIRIGIDKEKPVILSDFETIEELQAEFERLVKLFNEWEVFLNKQRNVNSVYSVKNKVNVSAGNTPAK